MNKINIIISVFVFLVTFHTGIINAQNDVISMAGNGENPPKIIFINYFDQFPTEPYPHKTDGPTIEVPPDERYLLPSYMTYLVHIILGSLSLIILFHLLRRRPIAHFEGREKFFYDRAEETELCNLRNSKQVDQSKLYYYQKRTNHISTSHKLCTTVGRDLNPEMIGLSDDEYAQRENVIIENTRLRRGLLDDEEDE